MPITGLGPHGERAAPPSLLKISDTEAAHAKARRFTVAVVLHTTSSDWAKQQIAGLVSTLGRYSAAVVEVVDCAFNAEAQVESLRRLIGEKPDAVVSIPIGNTAVAAGHAQVQRAGIKLVLLDNVPTGLVPGEDYTTIVSADNFGLGQIGAELLAAHMTKDAVAGLLSYGVDFFATNERHIAFLKWMETHRPDIEVRQAKFASVATAGAAALSLLDKGPALGGCFVAWDEPAMEALAAMKSRGAAFPVTTIDLGNAAAAEMAAGGLIKGIGAQHPYDQGAAAAAATILSLTGRQPPPWVALPGLSVTPQNVVEAYQVVWHTPAPREFMRTRRGSPAR